MGWILRGWDGEEELWKVFWIYGAFFIFLAKGTVIVLRLFTEIDLDNPSINEFRFLVGVEGLYCIWLVVSLWRCSFNNEWTIWAYCTRIMVVAYVVLYAVFVSYEGKMLEPKEIILRSYAFALEQAEPLMKKYGIKIGSDEKQGGA